MKVDDLKTWIVANTASYVAALSTVGVPLASITAGQVYTRDFLEPQQPVTVWLDPLPEEIEPLTMRTCQVTAKMELYVFVARGATEAVAREQTANYAQAIINALEGLHPDFFGFESREYYDGVEGKPDVKASKVTLVFKTEE